MKKSPPTTHRRSPPVLDASAGKSPMATRLPFLRACLFLPPALLLPALPLAAERTPEPEPDSTVVVTARRDAAAPLAATPVQTLAGQELVRRRMATLGETLAGLPGVHLDNFRAGAARPVIRGQTLPRIEVLSDGANLFDVSSVSPDHGIATDPLLLDAIEVQRGPGAVRHGGNASGGTINLVDSKVPKRVPEGGVEGATEVRYGSGDREKTVVGRITAGRGNVAVHAEGARRNAGEYEVPSAFGADRLRDSFADSESFSVGGSWITRKGYIGAAYTRVRNEYGLPGHSHANGVCHLHDYANPPRVDLHCVGHGSFQNPLGNPDSDTARIDLRSDRADVRADYADPVPGFSSLTLRASHTDYQHDEIDGPILYSRYTNKVKDGRIELTHKTLFGFTGTLGLQYTDGMFGGLNLIDLHVPSRSYYGFDEKERYATENTGLFISERRTIGPVDIEVAVRADRRTVSLPVPGKFFTRVPDRYVPGYINTYGPNWQQVLEEISRKGFISMNPDRTHRPLSASIGATWNLGGGVAAALSLARTERAPNMRELFANGNNLATNSYEVGLLADVDFIDPVLENAGIFRGDVIERSHAIDLTLRKAGGPLEFEVGLFHQDVDDYIYTHAMETETRHGVAHHFLVYTAGQARFNGIDGQASYRLTPASKVTVFGDYVHAELADEKGYLPRIPPARLGARYQGDWGPLSAGFELYRQFTQDRLAPLETRTDGYNMLNATLAYRFPHGVGRWTEVYLSGTNLTDELAYSHASFVKAQSPLRGRNIVFGLRNQF